MSVAPDVAPRGDEQIPSGSSADAAGGLPFDPNRWSEALPPGTVPVTDACHGDDLIDLTVRVVTLGAVRLWLSRFQSHSYPDTHRRAVAVQNWLATQRTHENRIPYRVWCALEVRRLRARGIDASMHEVPGTDRVAVVRTEVPR